jgi:two-component system chemotaxis sensor kinase CheA
VTDRVDAKIDMRESIQQMETMDPRDLHGASATGGREDESPSGAVEPPAASPGRVPAAPRAPAAATVKQTSDGSVRVRTERLDRLIDIVGELVIAHSMVAQDATPARGQTHDFLRRVTHVGKIVRELQDLSMSLRMVPLKPTFQKLARLARDVAHKFGREVTFTTSGEETEIDRNMVDLLADPLIHMVRNAVDHGIEPPDERTRMGKPSAGTLQLSAYHAGGTVVVEIQDDGRGLDREKIARKAISRGMIESDKGMSDSDVFAFIFEPGFSTASTVTEVSGRGVGLDVVRRAIQSLHGRIDIHSEKGKGTIFRLKVPLTLAVTDGMLIRVGAQRFIIPTASIHQTLRPEPSNLYTVIGRGEMLTIRGDLMPIIRIHRVFNVPGAIENPVEASLILVDDGEREFALMVDELLGQYQVVAKALGGVIERQPGLAGAAILGDGRVGLILDPRGLMSLLRFGGGSGRVKNPAAESLVS